MKNECVYLACYTFRCVSVDTIFIEIRVMHRRRDLITSQETHKVKVQNISCFLYFHCVSIGECHIHIVVGSCKRCLIKMRLEYLRPTFHTWKLIKETDTQC
jgi:hypothetical protein